MAKIDFPEAIKELHNELKKLPGIGPRSAERIAVWMIQSKKANPLPLAETLKSANLEVSLCNECGFFIDTKGCAICNSIGRDESLICVVEQPTDILPLERSGVFSGYYHCLGGKLAPLDNVTPDDLRIPQLIERVKKRNSPEVVLALTADVEGEATANYIAQLLEQCDCSVTRVAQGIPAGGGLENVDDLTIMRALQGRR